MIKLIKDNSIPSFDKEYLRQIQEYDPNLNIIWDADFERWAIKRFAEGKWHHCFFLNEEDGSYRPVDNRLIKDIWECDLWKNFGNDEGAGKRLHEFIQEKRFQANLKEKTLRREFLAWYNRDHKTEWKEAIENAKRGQLN